MQHTCQDCDHIFSEPGQSGPHIQPAVQCPQCHSYRTQPAGIPDEANDMLHGLQGMPTSTQDDMSGNPLQEGILADSGWKSRQVRDESFASSVKRAAVSLFETPEFETTHIVAPPDLYRQGIETEASHRTGIQIPNGITDNLHATLGNLGAWVDNPSENSQLRPYNQYWKVIRPSFMNPGSLRIGVADPTMAEIINHVAQTDDLAPLYEYRGRTSHTKTAGPLALLGEGASALVGGGAETAAGLAGGGEAAATAGAAEGGSSAAGVGGAMSPLLQGAQKGMGWELGKNMVGTGLNSVDDVAGLSGGGMNGGQIPQAPHDFSFYASEEDDAFPASHGEIPKNEDGDHKQQDDGNNHEWQRDISVNGGGGTEHSPSFDPSGPAFQRFMILAPLLAQLLESGEDASQDPLVQGLHQSLESEIPGYLDHADHDAGQQLLMILHPKKEGSPEAAPEHNDETHTDENSGGKHESRVASLHTSAVEGGDFLPDLESTPPALNGMSRHASPELYEIAELRKGLPSDVQAEIDRVIRFEGPRAALEYLQAMTRSPAQSTPDQGHPYWDSLNVAKTALTQGPQTPEQIQAVQQWLLEHGAEIGLSGEELIQTILSVPTNPLEFADVLAQVKGTEQPPVPDDAGMSATPPMPAQENAPPGATMPMPGMEQQMMSAVKRYAADSVAGKCPHCESHTTELLDEEGNSHCHGCGNEFKTEGKKPKKLHEGAGHDFDLDSGEMMDKPIQGVPMTDQQHPHGREEPVSHNTWQDEHGNPLKVGSQYEMYSGKYDIPDLVRVEAVRPTSLSYTITGEFGVEHSTELTKQEADIEKVSFEPKQGEEFSPEEGLEFNNDDNTAYQGSPEHSDASASVGLVSRTVARDVVASGVQTENPQLSWLMQGVSRTAGANYTPMEQRRLIDESGTARNADMLNLSGTHYIQDAEEDQFLFGY